MKQSLVLLFPFLVTACGGDVPPQPGFTDQIWQLKYITSDVGIPQIPPNTAHYSLRFSDDGTLDGTIDCNDMDGRYVAQDGAISITELSWTEKSCPDNHSSSSTAYRDSLSDGVRYTTQHRLYLKIFDRAGRQLMFEPAAVLCESPLPVADSADNIYRITSEHGPQLVEELEATRPDFALLETADCSPTFIASMNQNTLTQLRCRTDIESIE